MPSLLQFVKAGIGLAFGVWIAGLILYLPTVFLSLWIFGVVGRAMFRH